MKEEDSCDRMFRVITDFIDAERFEDAVNGATKLVGYFDSRESSPREMAAALLMLGFTLNEAGRHSLAIAPLTDAIHLNKELANAFFQRGVAYKKLNSANEAKHDLQMATKLSKRLQPDEFLELADLFMEELSFRDAQLKYQEALEIDINLYSKFRLAESLIEQSIFEEAGRIADSMRSEEQSLSMALCGWIKLAEKDYASSLTCFETSIGEINDDSSVCTLFGIAWLNVCCPVAGRRDVVQGLKCIDQIEKSGGIAIWETNFLRAIALAVQNRWNQATSLLKTVSQSSPEWSLQMINTVMVQIQQGYIDLSKPIVRQKCFPTRTF